jgi:hypothetical protein
MNCGPLSPDVKKTPNKGVAQMSENSKMPQPPAEHMKKLEAMLEVHRRLEEVQSACYKAKDAIMSDPNLRHILSVIEEIGGAVESQEAALEEAYRGLPIILGQQTITEVANRCWAIANPSLR